MCASAMLLPLFSQTLVAPLHASAPASASSPDATISAPGTVYLNADANVASVPTQSGASYAWSATGAVITSGANSPRATFKGTAKGMAVLKCSVTDASGVVTAGSANVSVVPSGTVSIQPTQLTMPQGATAAFTASTAGFTDSRVGWTASGGSIDPSGHYTAPTANGAQSVTATSVQNPAASASASVQVVDPGLMAWWRFSEGQGLLAQDSAGNGYTGTLAGGVAWDPAGRFGGGLRFDGATGVISVPGLNPFRDPFTVSLWVKLDAVNRGSSNGILFNGTRSSSDLALQLGEQSGKAFFGFGGDDLYGNTALTPGVWTHLTFVYDGSSQAIYINGAPDGYRFCGKYASQDANLTLGAWPVFGYLQGSLDEVRIYSRALSSTEVFQKYQETGNVIVSPRTALLGTKQSQFFSAKVASSVNGAVTWELPVAGSGSITASGAYTAPDAVSAEGTSFPVVARSVADPTQTDTVWVTVNSAIAVVPKTTSVLQGGQIPFTAKVTGLGSAGVTWSASAGTIDANGLLTAPSSAGTLTVKATSAVDGTQFGTATVNVGGGTSLHNAASLVGYWPFSEGQGPIAKDLSGWGAHGTLSNGPVWVEGKIGSGLYFDGANASVDIPAVNPFQGPFSVSAWVKFDRINKGTDNAILGHGVAQLDQGLLLGERNGKAYLGFIGDDLAGNQVLQAGLWTHLVFEYDGKIQKIYVNGALDASRASTGAYQSGLFNAQLGRYPWNAPWVAGNTSDLHGTLDEVQIYSRALGDAEVNDLFYKWINVAISPRDLVMAPGQSQTLTATVTGPGAVTWELLDAGLGSLSNAGVYTAPASLPLDGAVVRVRARSTVDTLQTDTVRIVLRAPLSILPASASVPANGQFQFSAAAAGLASSAVTWTAAPGTIDANGLFMAPGTPGTPCTITATSTADPTKKATATVSVGAPAALPPALYLPFDEGYGSSVSDASGANALTSLLGTPNWVPGRYGSAMAFTGSTKLLLSWSMKLAPSWTISSWIQTPLPATGNWHTLTRGYEGDHQVIVHSDQVSLGCYDTMSGSGFRDSGFRMDTLAAGWHLLTAVGSGGTTRFYVDGAAVGNVIPWQSQTSLYCVGSYQGQDQPFGTVDDFRLYNRALTPGEISAMYCQDQSPQTLLYLPFDEGAGSTVSDASGSNGPGALQGSPNWVPGKFGTGMAFTGSTKLLLPAPLSLPPSWTISAWVQTPLPSTGTWHTLTRGAEGDHQLLVHSDQVSLGCYDNSTGTGFRDSGFRMNTLPAGWHLMTVVGGGGSTRFYVDGAAVGNVIPWQSRTSVYCVGSYQGQDQPFGTVDDFRVYGRALNAAEVGNLFSLPQVSLSPTFLRLGPGQQQKITAKVVNAANPAVTWELPDANSGSMAADGTYTAPSTAPADGGAFRILARSVQNPSQTAAARVTVADAKSALFGSWSFEEGQGALAADLTGRGNTAFLSGDVSWSSGVQGGGLRFPGVGAASIPSIAAFPSTPFSVSGWVRLDQVNRGAQHNPLLGFGTSANGLVLSEYQGHAYFGGFDQPLVGNSALVAGQWTHLAFVYDGVQKRIYVNGALDGARGSAPFGGMGTNLQLGRIPWDVTHTLMGSMDEVRIYGRALQDAEVAGLYTQSVHVAVTPHEPLLTTGKAQAFAAKVSGAADPGVSWELSEPSASTRSGKAAVRVWLQPGSNSSLDRILPGVFQPGDVVTLSAWFKVPSGAKGKLCLANSGGDKVYQIAPGMGTWQPISLSLPITQAGPLQVSIFGDQTLIEGTQYVLYDDLMVTSMQRGLVLQEGWENGLNGWTPSGLAELVSAPTDTTYNGSSSAMLTYNDGSLGVAAPSIPSSTRSQIHAAPKAGDEAKP